MRGLAALALVLPYAFLAGCLPSGGVARVYHGETHIGRIVPPEAYAAFFEGSIAEAAGELDAAESAYLKVTELDPSALAWARIGAVRCTRRADDPGARWALARAAAIDPENVAVWEVRAKCAEARGDDPVSSERLWRHAARLEPARPAIEQELADAESRRESGRQIARARLVALAAMRPDDGPAALALGRWALAHGEVDLAERGYRVALQTMPSAWGETRRVALGLADGGHEPVARRIAADLVDRSMPREPIENHTHAKVLRDRALARLAIDQAILDSDEARIWRRASATRTAIETASARAILVGRRALARRLLEPVVGARPCASRARPLLALTSEPERALEAWWRPDGCGIDVPTSAEIALAAWIDMPAGASPKPDLGSVVHAFPRTDPLLISVAARLVGRGVLGDRGLPPEVALEATLLRGGAAASLPKVKSIRTARHRILHAAMRGDSAAAAPSGAGLGPVLLAASILAKRDGIKRDEETLLRAEPLVAAAVLARARRLGDESAEERALERLEIEGIERAP